MSGHAFKRVAYPNPDPKKIFTKIMDWLESNHLEVAEELESQLADDYMVGWETSDAFEKKQLGLLAANGWGDPDELKEVTRYSLLRGVEEWDMMISCAKSMKEKESNQNSLDGQDVLTYLAKLISPAPAEMVTNNVATQGTTERQLPKRLTSHKQATEQKKSKKKQKRNNASQYFAPTPHDAPSPDTKKKRKKEKRRAKRAKLYGVTEGNHVSLPVQSPPAVPVLQQAAEWYRSDNVIAPEKHKASSASSAAQQDQSIAAIETPRDTPPSTPRPWGNVKLVSKVEELDDAATAKSTAMEGSGDLAFESFHGKRYTLRAPSQTQFKTETLDGSVTTQSTSMGDGGPVSGLTDEKRHRLRSSLQTPKRLSTSKYFTTPKSSPLKSKSPRPPRGTVSCIPFPPLTASEFGLIQEKLADDPFRLLIAVTLLIRTHGKVAIPTYHTLMERYPTPAGLVEADPAEISSVIKHLGLSVVRAAQIQKYAQIWLNNPPRQGVRYGVKNYPRPGDGSDVRACEELLPEDEDSRESAWEIGHLTQGPYAIDSWRIFCRDVLLGQAEDWNGKGREGEFQPEWMRVLPLDKELRACLRWLWMKEGWAWDPLTGEREVLSEELRRAVDEGRVEWDNTGALQIIKADNDEELELEA